MNNQKGPVSRSRAGVLVFVLSVLAIAVAGFAGALSVSAPRLAVAFLILAVLLGAVAAVLSLTLARRRTGGPPGK